MTDEDKLDILHTLGELLYGDGWSARWGRLAHTCGLSQTPASGRAAVSLWRRRIAAPPDMFMDLVVREAREHLANAPRIQATVERYRDLRNAG